jgi:hypothetical protein
VQDARDDRTERIAAGAAQRRLYKKKPRAAELEIKINKKRRATTSD